MPLMQRVRLRKEVNHNAADGPNLLLIGAPRSGTSFLHQRLAGNPEIFAPRIKEPHFHLADRWPLGGPEAEHFTQPIAEFVAGRRRSVWGGLLQDEVVYQQLYAPGRNRAWRIEATPNYFAEGRFMAERLEDRLGPDVRAIVILRDPVERALSHHRLFRRLGWEDRSFDEALRLGPERVQRGWAPTWDYLRYSEYERPLSEWREVFGDRLAVVHFDDLTLRPDEVISELCAWLGLEPARSARFRSPAINGTPSGDGPSSVDADAAVLATGRLDLPAERAALESCRRRGIAVPLVSVAMTVSNDAATVGRAVERLLAQSYANVEIVVCDNGSTDDTIAIATDIAERDPRVIVQRHAAEARVQQRCRRALRTARGEFFLLATADDDWQEDFLSSAVRQLQLDPATSVCCGRMEPRPEGVAAPAALGGLLRTTALDGVVPDRAIADWRQYAALVLALRGNVVRIDVPAARRHPTPDHPVQPVAPDAHRTRLERLVARWGVARLVHQDRESGARSVRGRVMLLSFVLTGVQAPVEVDSTGMSNRLLDRVRRRAGTIVTRLRR